MNGRMCENEDGCEGQPYSWSAEHGNSVLCRKCYAEFIKDKDLKSAVNIFQKLTPDQKKKLVEALQ